LYPTVQLLYANNKIFKFIKDIDEMETKRTIERINETKSWFFEKITNIEKPLVKLTKRKREKTQIDKIRGKKEDFTTNTNEIQRIVREYYENLCSNKLDNLDEMDKFIDVYDPLKLNSTLTT
jgi:hypothetical protein